MSWQLIETAQVQDGILELYRRDEVFMIRANGLELMSGLAHQSETALGTMAVEVARNPRPNILIGGLGLGYTLAAAARAMKVGGSITVAELSPAVIDWFDRYVAASVLPMRPANVRIIATDIADHLGAAASEGYDVIVLDVDNGPEALVSPSNDRLYGPDGLRSLAARLAPDGVILLWSGFESPEFAARAKSAGFAVDCVPLASVGRADLMHYVFVLTRDGGLTVGN